MTYLATLIVIIFLVYLLNRQRFFVKTDLENKTLFLILSIKVLAGICLFLIYTHFYPDRKLADIFKYYDDGKVLVRVLADSPSDFFKILFGLQKEEIHSGYFNEMYTWYTTGFGSDSLINDSRAVIRLSSILHFFSFGSYHLHSFYFSLIGFFGQLFIYKSIRQIFPKLNQAITVIGVFLLPSVCIWTSGILKESALFLGIGLFTFFITNLLVNKKQKWLFFIFGTLLLLMFKYYIFICILPALIPILLPGNSRKKLVLLSISAFLIIGLIALNIRLIFPSIDLMNMFAKKHDDFYLLALHMDAGSISYIGKYKPYWDQFLPKVPSAFFNSFFQPSASLLLSSPSPTLIPAIIENLLLVSLPLGLFFKRKKMKLPAIKFILFTIIFLISLYTLTGLTTPVIGGIVRYKVPVLSFYFCSLLAIVDLSFFKKSKFIQVINKTLRSGLFLK